MPIKVSTNVLAQFFGSFVQGATSSFEKVIADKIESMGRDVISDLINSTPLGAGVSKRTRDAIETGGTSEFIRARNKWLNSLKPSRVPGSGLAARVQKAFDKAASGEGSRPEQGHWKWSKSRNEWLNEDWKHDWRSQPRDKIGRWIPGRLKTIYASPKVKKVRSARRRAIRKQVRESFRGN